MTQEQLLKDTINYYSANPAKRRCVNKKLGACYYSPKRAYKPLSEGCAIGRHLTPEAKIAFDDLASSDSDMTTISAIMEVGANKAMMPSWMQEMPVGLLADIQRLHDVENHWDSSGLTKIGKRAVNYIINRYSLDMAPLAVD